MRDHIKDEIKAHIDAVKIARSTIVDLQARMKSEQDAVNQHMAKIAILARQDSGDEIWDFLRNEFSD